MKRLTSAAAEPDDIDFDIPDGHIWRVLALEVGNQTTAFTKCVAFVQLKNENSYSLIDGNMPGQKALLWQGKAYAYRKVKCSHYGTTSGDILKDSICYQEAVLQ